MEKTEKRELFNLSRLLFIILFGAFIGSLAASRAENTEIFTQYWVNGGFLLQDHTFINGFTQALYSSVFTLFVLMLCGFCAVSQPLVLLTLLVRGFSLGAGICVTYLERETGGLFLTAVAIVPFGLLSSAVLVLAAREAIRSANIFIDFAFRFGDKRPDIKLYFLKFTILLILLMITILLQGVFCVIV
ncbi:MAG: hypothetical protein LBM93_11000 [Oscillospiraceae bacterium]|jgi:hypothetical protein|nr:hypothetical protein [Oscillospiraceae bacterium]